MPRRRLRLLTLALLAACAESRAPAEPPRPTEPDGPAAIVEVRVTVPVDSLEAGQWATLVPRIVDSRGVVRTDVPLAWTNETPDIVELDTVARRVRALARGTGDIHLRAGGRDAWAVVRAYDVPTSVGVRVRQQGVADGAPVDVESRATFEAFVAGRLGRPIPNVATGPVTFTCTDRAELWVRCDSVLVPRLQHLARPETLHVAARGTSLAGTTPVVVHEAPVRQMWVTWPPAPYLLSDTIYESQVAVAATVGDTMRVYAEMFGDMRALVNRPLRIVLDDPSIAAASLGGTAEGKRIVNVVGLREGTTRLRLLVNGAAVGVGVQVRGRAASCATITSLDLALGELRQLRGNDASRCLRLDRARDAGRAYLVVSDALPLETSRAPNAVGFSFDWEGQGLFRRSDAPVPRWFPVMRMYEAGGDTAAALATLTAAPAPKTGRGAWSIAGRALHEHPPAPRGPGGADLQAAQLADAPAIAVGDTIDLLGLAYVDPGLRTADGGPIGTRAVVVHVGPRLVAAELLDVLRGRLSYADGKQPPAIPASVVGQLEAEYVVPARQLERLFPGTPAARQAYGRDFGTRELFVNVPLAPGYGGYASASYVAVDYSSSGMVPRDLADHLLAHEFAHLRHMSRYWPNGSAHPWLVEGIANFAERLTMTARMTGLDVPSRTARLTRITDVNYRVAPSLGNTFFEGYGSSSYVFDYLADQAEAGGRDGLAAVRLLATASTVAQADAAVGAGLPGMGVHEMVLRARVAQVLEMLRLPECTTCVAPDPALPDWTRYLQYDVTSSSAGFFFGLGSQWPVLRPGVSGTVAQLRTGSLWPVVIDGREATADGTWVLDFSEAPQATVSVVRIR